MPDNNRKTILTPEDMDQIGAIWMRIGALQRLKEHALPPTAEGAWIYEAADYEISRCIKKLDWFYHNREAPVE